MIDREKVMQWLKICANGCEDGCPYEYKNLVYRVECKGDLMSDALELLKEQEPVSPIRDKGLCVCGNCGNWVYKSDRYCSKCGKAVKWNEAD